MLLHQTSSLYWTSIRVLTRALSVLYQDLESLEALRVLRWFIRALKECCVLHQTTFRVLLRALKVLHQGLKSLCGPQKSAVFYSRRKRLGLPLSAFLTISFFLPILQNPVLTLVLLVVQKNLFIKKKSSVTLAASGRERKVVRSCRGVCGLKLLAYAALRYQCMRP